MTRPKAPAQPKASAGTGRADKPPRLISEADWAAHRRLALAWPPTHQGTALPDLLLPYQQRAIRAMQQHRVTVIPKSRRIGMTWGLAAGAVLAAAAARSAGGMDALYIGYNLDMAREFVDTAAMWSRALAPAASAIEATLFRDDDADSAIQAFRIRYASGFELVALSSRPRSLRGRQGLVVIDEAAFHDDLAGLLKAAMAFLIWGGRVVVVSSHSGAANPFAQLAEDALAGRTPYAVLPVTFDDALEEGLYRRICLVTGQAWSPEAEAAWRAEIIAFYGENADEELFCIPSAGSGVWLPRQLIEARAAGDIPILRLALPEPFGLQAEAERATWVATWAEVELPAALAQLDQTAPIALGIDVARRRDLTVIWALQTARDLARRTLAVVELRRCPFAQQLQILLALARRLPRLTGVSIDATGQGAELAERAADALGPSRVDQVMLTTEWYRLNMPPLKAALEDGALTLPRDRDIAGDLASIRLVDGVARLPRQRSQAADGEGRHGDAAIAPALAFAASRSSRLEHQGYVSAETETEDGFARAGAPGWGARSLDPGHGGRLW